MRLTNSEKEALKRRFLESLSVEYIEGLYKIGQKLYDENPRFREDTHEMIGILQKADLIC